MVATREVKSVVSSRKEKYPRPCLLSKLPMFRVRTAVSQPGYFSVAVAYCRGKINQDLIVVG